MDRPDFKSWPNKTGEYLEQTEKYYSFNLKCDDFVILAPLFLNDKLNVIQM